MAENSVTQQSELDPTAQVNPFQLGVNKGLQKAGEQLSFEAASQGVPAEHILNKAGMGNQNQNVGDILKNLIGSVPNAGMYAVNAANAGTQDAAAILGALAGIQPGVPNQGAGFVRTLDNSLVKPKWGGFGVERLMGNNNAPATISQENNQTEVAAQPGQAPQADQNQPPMSTNDAQGAADFAASQGEPGTSSEPQTIDDQIAEIDKRTNLNIAQQRESMSKAPNFFQRFTNNLMKMEGGVTREDQIRDLANIQKISGGEPLQKKDIMDLNVNSYAAAVTATHEALSAKVQKFTGMVELLRATPRNIIDTTKGTFSPEGEQLLTTIKATSNDISTLTDNLELLGKQRPKVNSKGLLDRQSQETVSKIEAGKVGKYTYR